MVTLTGCLNPPKLIFVTEIEYVEDLDYTIVTAYDLASDKFYSETFVGSDLDINDDGYICAILNTSRLYNNMYIKPLEECE